MSTVHSGGVKDFMINICVEHTAQNDRSFPQLQVRSTHTYITANRHLASRCLRCEYMFKVLHSVLAFSLLNFESSLHIIDTRHDLHMCFPTHPLPSILLVSLCWSKMFLFFKNIFLQIIFTFYHMYSCCGIYAICKCRCPQRSSDSGPWLVGDWDSLNLGAGKWIQVLCKSSTCS